MNEDLNKVKDNILSLQKTFSEFSKEMVKAIDKLQKINKLEDQVERATELQKLKQQVDKENQS